MRRKLPIALCTCTPSLPLSEGEGKERASRKQLDALLSVQLWPGVLNPGIRRRRCWDHRLTSPPDLFAAPLLTCQRVPIILRRGIWQTRHLDELFG